MRTLFKKITLCLATSLYVFMAIPVQAADTELFTGLGSGTIAVRPNILFIVDTSGSMSSSVTVTTGTYDPNTTYDGDCVNTRNYYSYYATPPACDTSYYVEAANFYCNDAANTLGATGTGFYIGRFARYVDGRFSDYWYPYLSQTSPTECEADYGVHGDGSNTTDLYPANSENSGPWRANDTDAISWAEVGYTYTFYNGNYLNWINSPGVSTTMTRLEVVQEVLKNIINSTSGINAALMRYDARYTGNAGGYFVEGMQEIDTTTRSTFNATIDLLTYGGYTPLAETMYEAMMYYRGDSVYFGDDTTPETNVSAVLDPADTSQYKSPIEFQCQKNFTVLLTDGVPVYDSDADAQLPALTGFDTLTGGCGYSADDCLDEIAQYMYETDQRPDLNGSQNIITYTIGFATDQTLLEDTARKGGSTGGINGVGYYTADSIQGLTTAFTSIITSILDINTTFVAPAVSVNAFNRLTHRSELYFAIFHPESSMRWPGNLKRYKLQLSVPTDLTSELIVADANGVDAVDTETGFFKKTAQSFWSSTTDGSDVSIGGAAENLPLDRNVYTYTGATDANNSSLNVDTNKLHEDNDVSVDGTGTLTNTLLGLDATTTDADRIELIKWARGIDVYDEDGDGSTTDSRNFMGDPLHSKPYVVTYAGTDETNLDTTIYMSTNEGHLHAIRASDGVELFSFIPAELLPNLNLLKDNASGDHAYGLDGPMTIWHNDLNNNFILQDSLGNIESTDGVNEHIYLYMGMRRGGKNYYALDVSNRNNPKLKWVIKGGVADTDFEELAQTWSKATLAKIKFNGAEKMVLIFGGGYDVTQDVTALPADDTAGRAIYIVDAESGDLLWWAGPASSTANLKLADMNNSIAADIRTIDSNNNGYVDRLYTADLGGRIWRIDLDEEYLSSGTSALATGGAIADLGGDDEANNRRFYYAPSVSFGARVGERYYALAIGSGYRSHPLNTVIYDRFYLIRDTDVDSAPTDTDGTVSYTTLTEADLYDATDNTIGEGDQTASDAAIASLNSSNGWYFSLNEFDGSYIGEKVMSSPVTFAGVVIFPTFTPVASADSNSCSPSQGTTYGYVVSLYDAKPVFNFDSNPDLTRIDRRAEFNGLPTEPSIIFNPEELGGGVTLFFGTQKLPEGNNSTGCNTLTCLYNKGEGKQGGRDTKYITESVNIQ